MTLMEYIQIRKTSLRNQWTNGYANDGDKVDMSNISGKLDELNRLEKMINSSMITEVK